MSYTVNDLTPSPRTTLTLVGLSQTHRATVSHIFPTLRPCLVHNIQTECWWRPQSTSKDCLGQIEDSAKEKSFYHLHTKQSKFVIFDFDSNPKKCSSTLQDNQKHGSKLYQHVTSRVAYHWIPVNKYKNLPYEIRMYIKIVCMCIYIYVCLSVCLPACLSVYACMNACMHVCMYVYTYNHILYV